MAKIIWTSEAERWLLRIYKYIAEENPRAAAKVIDGIYDKFQILLDKPKIGYLYEHEAKEIRIILYGHYRITYLSKPNQDIVILGAFHGALLIENYIVT